MKIRYLFLAVSLMLLLAGSASALVDVNYKFNTNDVYVEAYNCANAECSQVTPFSGSFPDGKHTTNGQITIEYPSTLATTNGYAVYYFSPKYLPKGGKATWHSYGLDGIAKVNVDVAFQQKDICRSVIDTFTITNDQYTNLPVIINMSTSLDASTKSAFSLVDSSVKYIPTQYLNKYFGADTKVTLTITDQDNNVVNNQQTLFTEANGNTLLASTARDVSYTWTPKETGTHKATLKTEVIDDQCYQTQILGTDQIFNVLRGQPRNEYYTKIDGLRAVPSRPYTGDTVEASFEKISNFANDYPYNDPRYTLTPVPTDIIFTIQSPTGTSTTTETLSANPNAIDPTTHTFTFVPQTNGTYIISVSGKPGTHEATSSLTIYVEERPMYPVKFKLVDSVTTQSINDATITFNALTQNTDANGETTFRALEGTYSYTITKSGYETLTGTIKVAAEILRILTMNPTQAPIQDKFPVHFTVQSNGQLLDGAQVQFNGITQNTVNGKTDFANVSGPQEYVVSKNGFNTARGIITVNSEQSVVVNLITQTPQEHTLTILVVDGINPISAAQVIVNGISKTTDAAGKVQYSLVAGTYDYSITKVGYNPTSGNIVMNNEDITMTIPLTIILPTEKTVIFNVSDETKQVSNARIDFAGKTLYTDDNGQLQTSVIPGTYSYTVSKTGYYSKTENVNVQQNTIINIRLEKEPVQMYTLNVEVSNGTDAIAGASVNVAGVVKTTNAQGIAQYNLAKGEYTYTVTATDYLSAAGLFNLQSDATISVILVKLPPTPTLTHELTFSIKGINGDAIANANIAIAGTTLNSDINGIAKITLPIGTYGYTISKEGYNTVMSTVSLTQDTTVNVILGVNQTTEQYLVTFTTSDYSGRIDNVTIVVGNTQFMTGSNGQAILNFQKGNYTFVANKLGYQQSAGTFEVTGNRNVDIIMSLTGTNNHIVTFQVVDESGKPIKDATITMNMAILTNFNGEATFNNINDGTYMYSAGHPDYESVSGQVIVSGGNVYVRIVLKAKQISDEDNRLKLSSARLVHDEVHAGQYAELLVYLTTDKSLDNVEVRATIPEFNVLGVAGPTDMSHSLNKKVSMWIPSDATPGKYLIRVYVGNGKYNRVVYREITVL